MYSVVLAAMLTTGPARPPHGGSAVTGAAAATTPAAAAATRAAAAGLLAVAATLVVAAGRLAVRSVFVLRRRLVHRRLQLPGLLGLLRLCQRFGCCGYSACYGGAAAGAATPAAAAGWYRNCRRLGSRPSRRGGVVARRARPRPRRCRSCRNPYRSNRPRPPGHGRHQGPDGRPHHGQRPGDRPPIGGADFHYTGPPTGQNVLLRLPGGGGAGGKTVTRTQTVIVKAGQESRADFGDLTAADAPAHVTITAPADARLTVDDVEIPGSAHLQHAAAAGGAHVLLHGDGGDDARRPQGQRQPACWFRPAGTFRWSSRRPAWRRPASEWMKASGPPVRRPVGRTAPPADASSAVHGGNGPRPAPCAAGPDPEGRGNPRPSLLFRNRFSHSPAP